MQPEKSLFKQLIKITVVLIVILTAGSLVFLMSNRSNLVLSPPSTITYHPSISTIETYLKKEDFIEANNEALKYSQEHPNDSTAYKYLGISLFQIGEYSKSTQNFELALKDKSLTSSTKAEIYYFMGRNYDFLIDSDTAVSYFQKAIEINPDYSLPYGALGAKALRKKSYDEAFSFFEKELSLIPDAENNPLSSYPYYYLAQAYFETNDYNKAQQMIEMAQKLAQQLSEPKPIPLLNNIKSLQLKIEEKLIK
jgi:tetratricopeptide (TPR) repeat protein